MTDTKVKRKAGRPKGSTDSKKRPEQTEAQKAAHFKKGEVNNAEGWSLRKETRAYRKWCASFLLTEVSREALAALYCSLANNGQFKEFMELNRFMAEYAFGKPKEMLETEEIVSTLAQGSENTPPLFGFVKETAQDAVDSDDEYV